MSFVLNLTSLGAGAREIVRTRTVAADVLTIGRDPASDIHLTDLEVTRHHAEIRRTAPGTVTVRALASIPLTVDGRSTEEAEILVAQGGDIRIGETRIAIAAGDSDAIAVSVTRESVPREEADDAAKRFSIAGTMLGKRVMAWTLGLVILAVFLIWPIWSFNQSPTRLTDAQMASGYHHIDASWSSGPLSRAHAKLERNCKACHVQAFVAVPDSACKSCHTDIRDHGDPKRLALALPKPGGIAGAKLAIAEMFGRNSGRCIDCHAEHSGPATMPAPKVSCTSCHAALNTRLPDTALGNASDFSRAHPQLTATVMTTPGDYPRFTKVALGDPDTANIQDSALRFPHALHMSRSGGVARMQFTLGRGPLECTECHIAEPKGARFKPVEMERNCSQCHSLALPGGGGARTIPHGDSTRAIAAILNAGANTPPPTDNRARPGLIQSMPLFSNMSGAVTAVRAAFSPRGACYDCHVVQPPSSPGGLDYRVVPVREQDRFMNGAWFDHRAHKSATCASCHGQALETNDARTLMLPGIATCRQCHGGEQARAPMIRSTCTMCHDYHHVAGPPRTARSLRLAMLWPLRPSPGAMEGEGKNADRPDFRSAYRVRF